MPRAREELGTAVGERNAWVRVMKDCPAPHEGDRRRCHERACRDRVGSQSMRRA